MESSLKILRDRGTGTAEFRRAAQIMCGHLMQKTRVLVCEHGGNPHRAIIVIILRAAIVFFDAAVQAFPGVPVGVFGLKRDEHTLNPRRYYENLPPVSPKNVIIILDPMLATGGTAEATVERLKERGADSKNIYFVGIVAAPEGRTRLAKLIPEKNIILGAVDQGLDEHSVIVPGIGDFGDRYFGYAGRAIID